MKKNLNIAYLNGESLSVVKLNILGDFKVKRQQGGNEPVEDNAWLWDNDDVLLWDNGNKMIIK